METDFSQLSQKLVYQTADLLLAKKEEIETHLAEVEASLFNLNDTIVLYDLTNTYFEGSASKVSTAAFGKSKEKRNDCPLVALGLVLTKEGFPQKSRVFEGNILEPSTLKSVLENLRPLSTKQGVVVLDAGIATEENLKFLRSEGYCYIASSRTRKHAIKEDLSYQVVRKDKGNIVKAVCVENQKTGETELHCHSLAREQKELGIEAKVKKRFEEQLAKLNQGLSKKGCTKAYAKVLETVGRLRQRYSRISQYYGIEVVPDKERHRATEVRWKFNEASAKNRFNGAYCLRV